MSYFRPEMIRAAFELCMNPTMTFKQVRWRLRVLPQRQLHVSSFKVADESCDVPEVRWIPHVRARVHVRLPRRLEGEGTKVHTPRRKLVNDFKHLGANEIAHAGVCVYQYSETTL
jgi:hypothetical protein